jgi:hypothetical protein
LDISFFEEDGMKNLEMIGLSVEELELEEGLELPEREVMQVFGDFAQTATNMSEVNVDQSNELTAGNIGAEPEADEEAGEADE